MDVVKSELIPKAKDTLKELQQNKTPLSRALLYRGEPSIGHLQDAFLGEDTLEVREYIDALREHGFPSMAFFAYVLRQLSEGSETKILSDIFTTPYLVSGDIEIAGPFVCNGDARSELSLVFTSSCLILGDLVVDGVIADAQIDGEVIILGNCSAKALETFGNFLVLGDLLIDDVIFADYSRCSLIVGGDLKTRFLARDNHDVRVFGETHTQHNTNRPEQAEGVLVDEFVDTRFNAFIWDVVFQALRAGESVFQND